MKESISAEDLLSLKMRELREKAKTLDIDIPIGTTKETLVKHIMETIDADPASKEILEAQVTPVYVDSNDSKPSQFGPVEQIKGAKEDMVTVKIRKSIPRCCIGKAWYEVNKPKNVAFVERKVPRTVAEVWEQAGYL